MKIFSISATAMVAMMALASSSQAASFSCHDTANRAERAICASPRLGALDERMAYWYGRALERAGYFDQTAWVVRSQRRWLSLRNVCGSNTRCLTYAYTRRIERLKNYVEHV